MFILSWLGLKEEPWYAHPKPYPRSSKNFAGFLRPASSWVESHSSAGRGHLEVNPRAEKIPMESQMRKRKSQLYQTLHLCPPAGRVLRKARLDLGLKCTELSSLLGGKPTAKAISQFERVGRHMSHTQIVRVARYLDLDPHEVLTLHARGKPQWCAATQEYYVNLRLGPGKFTRVAGPSPRAVQKLAACYQPTGETE
jgi:hypothetical protein